MADNTSEEDLSIQANIQPENSSEKISVTGEEAVNLDQESEKMEARQHSHSSHAKRNWKSYFWEFLMLFLAVFCGFLAEYQLEHKIERERAKKYMHDMVENLKYDTARCNKNLAANVLLGKNMDSLRFEISEAIKGNINSNRLYDLWLRIQDYNQVALNRSAITQLKNAGNLRLIKNDSLAAAVIDYYDRKSLSCETAKDAMIEISKSLNKMSLQFFYFAPFDEILKLEDEYGKPVPDSVIVKKQQILNSNPPLTLLNTEPKALMLLYNEVASKEKALKHYNYFVRGVKEGAELLITDIEKVYRFSKK